MAVSGGWGAIGKIFCQRNLKPPMGLGEVPLEQLVPAFGGPYP